jgi:hypothetical protein
MKGCIASAVMLKELFQATQALRLLTTIFQLYLEVIYAICSLPSIAFTPLDLGASCSSTFIGSDKSYKCLHSNYE